MARQKNILNAFKPVRVPGPTPLGQAGYDNARENIDPHIRTKVVSTKELTLSDGSGAGYVKNDANGVLSGGNAAAGGGDVTAAVNLTDEKLVQGDGGVKGVKTTTVTPAEIASNTSARHTQGTDTALGAMASDINLNSNNLKNVASMEVQTNGKVEFRDSEIYIQSNADGEMTIEADSKINMTAPVAVTGNITVSGTVDGRDVAADGIVLDDLPVSNLANGTDGELITWDASGAPATVPVGTAGHVLTSNGVGAAPTFQASAGGGGAQTNYLSSTGMNSINFNSNVWAPICGGFENFENNRDKISAACNIAMTFTKLGVRVLINSCNSTTDCTLDVEGSNVNNTIQFAAGTTGHVVDASSSDSVSAGDRVVVEIDTTASSSGSISYFKFGVTGTPT